MAAAVAGRRAATLTPDGLAGMDADSCALGRTALLVSRPEAPLPRLDGWARLGAALGGTLGVTAPRAAAAVPLEVLVPLASARLLPLGQGAAECGRTSAGLVGDESGLAAAEDWAERRLKSSCARCRAAFCSSSPRATPCDGGDDPSGAAEGLASAEAPQTIELAAFWPAALEAELRKPARPDMPSPAPPSDASEENREPLLCRPLPRRIVMAEAVAGRPAAALDGRAPRRRAAVDSAAELDGAPNAGAAANVGAGAAALP